MIRLQPLVPQWGQALNYRRFLFHSCRSIGPRYAVLVNHDSEGCKVQVYPTCQRVGQLRNFRASHPAGRLN